METFAAYGFNKSHSAAYAVLTFQTAYLKAHYRTEFLAGLLSLESGDADNTFKNIAECRGHGIAILQPDVNESRENFTVVAEAIRFGLGAVKGVGSKAIEAIIAAREEGGAFTGLHDFCLRVRGQLVNRKVLESLIACGAFDQLERNRARLWAGSARRALGAPGPKAASPQLGLFGREAMRAGAHLPWRTSPRGRRTRRCGTNGRRSGSSSRAIRSIGI
jgi:DNA polymerase-3 subunit alpha